MSLDQIYLPRTELPIVHLAERLRELRAECAIFPGPDCSHLPTVAALAERIGWTDTHDTFAELDASISLDHLAAADDVPPTSGPYDPAAQSGSVQLLSRVDVPTRAASTLRTLSVQVAAGKLKRPEPRRRKARTTPLEQRCCFSTNYRHLAVPRTEVIGARQPQDTSDATASSSSSAEPLMEPGSELLVVVRVYQPFK